MKVQSTRQLDRKQVSRQVARVRLFEIWPHFEPNSSTFDHQTEMDVPLDAIPFVSGVGSPAAVTLRVVAIAITVTSNAAASLGALPGNWDKHGPILNSGILRGRRQRGPICDAGNEVGNCLRCITSVNAANVMATEGYSRKPTGKRSFPGWVNCSRSTTSRPLTPSKSLVNLSSRP